MKVFLAALALIAFAVFLLCFNIIFRDKPFPDGEISRNKEMRRRGIVCMNEVEIKLHGKKKRNRSEKCDAGACDECAVSCHIKEVTAKKEK